MELFSKFVILLILIKIYSVECNMVECSANNCDECIRISSNCAWCSDENFNSSRRADRCQNSNLIDKVCQQNNIKDLKNEQEIVKGDFKNPQFGPEKFKIAMRAGSQINLTLYFKRAVDYPVDLYYLMDLSCTMRLQKENLAKVGEDIANKLSGTTKQYTIGFGSYVDKPVIPFSHYDISKLNCYGIKQTRETYSFINTMPLKKDVNEFVKKVSESIISGNVDEPEGTLDALMQVVVCGDKIGWRNKSNKIIVVATDERFHYSGDGKLAGITIPNDGACHLEENSNQESEYTHALILDYPSMHHIAHKIRENKFNIIFSVTENVIPHYEILTNIIGTNAKTVRLESNSRSIVDIIDRFYKEIRESVELKVDFKPDNIDVEIYSNCLDKEYRKTTNCMFQGFPNITFHAIIKMNSCPIDSAEYNNRIQIGLTNLDEKITIDLKMLCECNCDETKNAEQCSRNGTFSCGVCAKCNGHLIGDKCDCDLKKNFKSADPKSACTNKGDKILCSGHGNCTCGCKCNGRYSGTYCEIDDKDCYENQQNIQCNGNGNCVNGTCNCLTGYTGNRCHCTNSTDTCINEKNNNTTCSGNGDCRCGECKCINTIGKYCQKCQSCENLEVCKKLMECIPELCREIGVKCDKNCTDLDYKNVTKLSHTSNSHNSHVDLCQIQSYDCDFSFSYLRHDEELENNFWKTKFTVEKPNKICPKPLDLLLVSIYIIGSVILIGLACILIWKLITEFIDRREYSRFKKEIAQANWEQNENPIFKNAMSNFTNPTFGKKISFKIKNN